MNISKTKISFLSRLRNKKFRQEHRLFIVEGTKGVTDTINEFPLECLVATDEWLQNHRSVINNLDKEKILTGSRKDLDKISSLSTPADVIAIYETPVFDMDISEALAPDYYLVLDGIQDPGNLGTIIRTAHWFGFKTIFCSLDTVDVFNPKTIQSTMGSLPNVRVCYCDISQLISSNSHLESYALDLNGENIFKKARFNEGFYIFGREGSGLRDEIRKNISNFLTIPSADATNHPDSLNVAIAAAITMAQIRR